MKKYRLSIGILSILIASLYLFFDLDTFILQQKYPEVLWHIPIPLKTSLSSWLVAFLLLFAGVLLLFKNELSQYLYCFFGISVIIEVYTQIIYYNTVISRFDYFLLLPIFMGIFSLMIVTSEKWKNKLGWDKKISLKVWFIYLIVSFLISALPRVILEYPTFT